jgi:nicotinamidase/pyrazinamidase
MTEATRRKFLIGAGALAALTAAPAGMRLAMAATPGKIRARPTDALLVIDVQNCFIPGGSLAVKGGDEIVPLINQIAKVFENVVITQDWHTADHVSFASSHPGKKPFEMVKLGYGDQVLWPDHCVQGTEGAAVHKDLSIPHAQLVIRKGFHKDVDSYSAFLEADRKTETGLAGYLKGRGIKRVFLVGLATDYCVAWSALDARRFGFEAAVIEDACRGIDLDGSIAKAWADMKEAGVQRVQSGDIALG